MQGSNRKAQVDLMRRRHERGGGFVGRVDALVRRNLLRKVQYTLGTYTCKYPTTRQLSALASSPMLVFSAPYRGFRCSFQVRHY